MSLFGKNRHLFCYNRLTNKLLLPVYVKIRYILPSTLLVLATVRLVALPVSLASQFDVVVKNNFTLDNAHIHGSSAVGGNVVLNGNKSEFGNNMNPAAGPALVVAGNVVMNTGANVNGSKTANIGSLTLGQSVDDQGLNAPGNLRLEAQTVNVGAVGLDFNAAFDEFALLSQSLADLASTVVLSSLTSGDAQNRTLNLGFTGANNVLNLSYEDFLSIKNIQVGNPGADAGSWIINVDLDGYNGDAIVQNRNGNDDGADLILWNFFGASTLTLQNQFYGTVLAAEIDFTHNGNNLKGQVIASSFTMLNGQVHIHTYDGDLPPPPAVPESGSVLFAFAGALTLLVSLRARRSVR